MSAPRRAFILTCWNNSFKIKLILWCCRLFGGCCFNDWM